MNKRTFLTAAIIASCLVLNFSASMAQFLHDASEIAMSTKKATIWLDEKSKGDETMLKLPVLKPNVEIPVIELILN